MCGKKRMMGAIIISMIIGVCILISSLILANSIKHYAEKNRYEMIVNETDIGDREVKVIIFDKETGKYYSSYHYDGDLFWSVIEDPFKTNDEK